MKEPKRTARGAHLTYKAEDESYLMIGTPVEVIEEEPTADMTGGVVSGVEEVMVRLASAEKPLSLPEVS